MIRINLLGVPRAKKGKRSSAAAVAAVSSPGEGMGAGMLLAAGAVLGLIVAAGLYYTADKEAKETTTKLEAANREGARLSQVKTKYEQRKKEAALQKHVIVQQADMRIAREPDPSIHSAGERQRACGHLDTHLWKIEVQPA